MANETFLISEPTSESPSTPPVGVSFNSLPRNVHPCFDPYCLGHWVVEGPDAVTAGWRISASAITKLIGSTYSEAVSRTLAQNTCVSQLSVTNAQIEERITIYVDMAYDELRQKMGDASQTGQVLDLKENTGLGVMETRIRNTADDIEAEESRCIRESLARQDIKGTDHIIG